MLLDVRMPGIGGIRAAAAIRELHPAAVVLLVSSTHPDDLGRDAQGCRADAVVWKGHLRAGLLDEVWSRCGHRRVGARTLQSD